MSPVLHVVARRTNRDFGREGSSTRHLASCQPINQVFGVRLSVSMVGSLGHLVDRGVLGRCSCMRRSGLVRTPPCHANWHVSASHNCLGLWHSRISAASIDTSVSLQLQTPVNILQILFSCASPLITTPTPSSPAHHAPPSSHSSPSSSKHASPGAPHRRAVMTSSHHASSADSPVAHSPVSHAVPVPSGLDDDGSNGLRMAVCFPTRTTESEAHFVVLGVFEDIFCQL